MKFKNIPEMLLQMADKYGYSKEAIRYKSAGKWIGVSHMQLKEMVENMALGLCELGINPKDRVGIISESRIEWIVADFAISSIKAISVPVFPTLQPKQLEYIFNDCAVSAIFVSSIYQLNKLLQVKDNIPSLRHIILMDEKESLFNLLVKQYNKVMERGKLLKKEPGRESFIEEIISHIKNDDLATIIYTSGTTGEPKGVMLSHKNLISNIDGVINAIDLNSNDVTVSYLPLNHSFEKTTGYYTIFAVGATMNIAESVETIAANIAEVKPTLMTTVPRMLETIRKKIIFNASKEKPAKRKIFFWALKVGEKYAKYEGHKIPPILKTKYSIADKFVFSKIREKLGGRFRFFASGGAPINEKVQLFFHAIGIPVLQGYGLTESAPVVSVTRLNDNEIGTIGKPLHNEQVKLADDGEILVKGPNVMKGYWNDRQATDEAIDSDGWLYTGDIGIITERGNIKITDRKKHLFVSSGGKNIAPQPIESLLSTSRYIEQVILIGDRREYITALITPDFEELKGLADELSINNKNPNDLISNEKIIRRIKSEIDYLQKDLSKYERVRKFRLLSQPFTVESGELSQKLSVKRHVVERNFSSFIDEMYGDENIPE